MKKFAAIVLTCLYALSVTGLALNSFYCCGKLASVSISTSASPKQGSEKKGCCDTSTQTIQVKDQHVASGSFALQASPVIDLLHSFYHLDLACGTFSKDTLAFSYHAPSVTSRAPINTLNCTFRI